MAGGERPLSAKPIVIESAHDGITGEQEIVVSGSELKGQNVHYRAVLEGSR